jgi:hypothetical protein
MFVGAEKAFKLLYKIHADIQYLKVMTLKKIREHAFLYGIRLIITSLESVCVLGFCYILFWLF